MGSSPTVPPVDAERAAALAADAVTHRPLPPAAQVSLDRAVERLPEAIAESEAEARQTK